MCFYHLSNSFYVFRGAVVSTNFNYFSDHYAFRRIVVLNNVFFVCVANFFSCEFLVYVFLNFFEMGFAVGCPQSF